MFIKDSVCISPQQTFPSEFREEHLHQHIGNKYFALEPSYDGIISPGVLRRMGKAVRMGVAAGTYILRQHPPVDGILIGTANGGLEDCIKFLNQIVDYDEGTLTPTSFVQSTPNAIAGQLAIAHQNTGYNITHAHGGHSFENALIDASLLFEQGDARSVLVGTLEEISSYNYNIDQLSGLFKQEPTSSTTLLSSGTKGTVSGEGATMFLLEPKQSVPHQARIRSLTTLSHVSPELVRNALSSFLSDCQLKPSDVDTVLLGYNGDRETDRCYDEIRDEFPEHTSLLSFKNACGEYPTASSFAVWVATKILAGAPIPPELKLSSTPDRQAERVLIYNQYQKQQHSLILLEAVSHVVSDPNP
jgi:3-oxoacyl-(acyl-carrier-protein) synthase